MYLQFFNHICIQCGHTLCEFFYILSCLMTYIMILILENNDKQKNKSTSKCSRKEELQEIHLTGFIHNLSCLLRQASVNQP